MKHNKRIYFSITWIIIGVILLALSFAGKVDEFWSSFGFAIAIVGTLQIFRYHRFSKNEAYRERMEIAESDERNHFIRNKAWAWAGYLFVLTASAACIILRIIGQDLLSITASYAVCLMLIFYWISYFILKRKY